MTQPVQEPSQGRINQGVAFKQRQLFRRPPGFSAPDLGALLTFTGKSLNGEDTMEWTDDGSDPALLRSLSPADEIGLGSAGLIIATAWIQVEGISTRRCTASFAKTGGGFGWVYFDGYNDGYAAPRTGASEVSCSIMGMLPSGGAPTDIDAILNVYVNNFAAATDTLSGELTIVHFPGFPNFG